MAPKLFFYLFFHPQKAVMRFGERHLPVGSGPDLSPPQGCQGIILRFLVGFLLLLSPPSATGGLSASPV